MSKRVKIEILIYKFFLNKSKYLSLWSFYSMMSQNQVSDFSVVRLGLQLVIGMRVKSKIGDVRHKAWLLAPTINL